MIKLCMAGLLIYSGLVCCAATAPRRALILGNDSYPSERLQNARNDARAIAGSLEQMGYVTSLLLDGDRRTLARKVEEFAQSIHPGDVALVYYAGHGLQVEGENYLVPTDFHITDEADVPSQGYALSRLLQKLSSHGAATEIIILDACRNNPFAVGRSMRGGWAGMSSSAGTFLAFGTSPGSTASDDPQDGHGLFTLALLRYINTSPLGIEGLFEKVREDVIRESNGRQVPWTASSLVGSFHLIPNEDASSPKIGRTMSFEEPFTSAAAPTERGLGGQAAGVTPQVMRQVDQAMTEIRAFRLKEAISLLTHVLSVVPTYGVALRLLGIALDMTGRSEQAMRTFDQAISVDPKDALAFSYRCVAGARSNAQAAIEDCQHAIELDETIPQAHIGLGLSLSQIGQEKRANEELGRAIILDKESNVQDNR